MMARRVEAVDFVVDQSGFMLVPEAPSGLTVVKIRA
jgi:hypothetical protein